MNLRLFLSLFVVFTAVTANADQYEDYLSRHDVLLYIPKARIQWSPEQQEKWNEIQSDYQSHVEQLRAAFPAKGTRRANGIISFSAEETKNRIQLGAKLRKIRREHFTDRVIKLMTDAQRKKAVGVATEMVWHAGGRQLTDEGLAFCLDLSSRQNEERRSLIDDLDTAVTPPNDDIPQYDFFPTLRDDAIAAYLRLLTPSQKETLRSLPFDDTEYEKHFRVSREWMAKRRAETESRMTAIAELRARKLEEAKQLIRSSKVP